MINYDSKKLTELVLFILGKTGGIDFYPMAKVLNADNAMLEYFEEQMQI